MARKPNPGSDDGVWGDLLNAYLDVAHDTDGSIKDVGIVAQKYVKPVAGIPKTDLTSAVQASLDNADAAVTGTAPAASSTTPGLVQLTGDLGGTSTSPTVPGLASRVPTTRTVNGYALSADVTVTKSDITLGNVDNTSDASKPVSTATQTALNLKANLASPTFTGTVTVPTPTVGTDAANKTYVDGVVGSGASDATTTSKGIVQLAGDLGGTAALPTVPGLTAKATDTAVVHNTGTETVDGVKTFSSSPVVPTPTTSTQAANKSYVDGAVSASSGGRTAVAKTVNYTAVAGDFVIGDASSAAFTVTLPAATNGAEVSVKKVDSSVNGILVQPASGQIDGSASVVVNTQWQSKDFFSDGTTWYQV